MIPTPHIGWHFRKKSDHFKCYAKFAAEFAGVIEVEPWTICADFDVITDDVDLTDETSVENLASHVDAFLAKLRPLYKEHGITHEPYAFIKNESGTYGIGIMTAFSGDDIRKINRKQRNKMAVAKGGEKIDHLIIQEGVPTIDRFDNLTAEPVIYLVANEVCGGFFRLNDQKDDRQNLNSNGMKFSKFCFDEMPQYSNGKDECTLEELTLIYKSIARVASLAAGCEILQTENQ